MTVEAISEEDWLILTLHDFIDLHNNAFATSASSNQTASAFHLNVSLSFGYRQALLFLRCFWSRLIHLISKDTNMLFSMYLRKYSRTSVARILMTRLPRHSEL